MAASQKSHRLIERLPGPANLTPLIKFALIQTGNYATFARQCSNNNNNNVTQSYRGRNSTGNSKHRDSNTSSKTTLAEALSWEPLGRRFHWFLTCAYLYLLIKYRLIGIMSNEFGYLDCLVLGRFRFIGRTNKISGEILTIFLTCFLLYRWTVYLYVPNFKFFALEFLISDGHETPPDYLSGGGSGKPRRGPCHWSDQFNARGVADERVASPSISENEFMEQFYRVNRPERPETQVNSVAYLRDPFDMQQERWFLRPNRTRESWLTLSLWTKYMLYCTTSTIVLWLCLGFTVIGGSIASNLGFEMSYPVCVSWLRNIQSVHRQQPPDGINNNTSHFFNDYSHIYLAPRVLAHEITIDDIPARIPLSTHDLQAATLFTIIRILADTVENFLIFLECILLFTTQSYLLATNSLDVVLNANAIKTRLISLLEKLETRMNLRHAKETRAKCYSSFIESAQSADKLLPAETNYRKMSTFNWTSNHAHQFPDQISQRRRRRAVSLDCLDEKLQDEIVELQAILADHFYTITRGYNLYVSFIIGLIGLCWLLYTATLCIWMSSIKSRAIELEFVVTEANVTLFCLALTIGATLVRSRNLQLYSLITRAMALNPDHSVTKLRWTAILKYFYPKPFHCFTLFGSTEISVLLGLKIISWILSAFIVLANFVYTSKIYK